MPVASQKLIALGKIMENEKTLADYKVKEGSFLVVMVTKPKKPKKPKEEPKPTESATAQASTEPADAPMASESAPAQTPSAPAQPATAPAALNEDQEASIAEMETMGFPREECLAALRAAFFNKERAVEYLLNGIPEGMDAPMPPAGASPGGAGPVPGAGAMPPMGGAGAGLSPEDL